LSSFQEENDELVQSFLERTFFRGWREHIPNFSRLEIYMSPECNLDCAYCYVAKHGNELYPAEIRLGRKDLVKNGKMLVDWLVDNDFVPDIDIFSGEPSVKPEFYELVKYIIDKYKNFDRKPQVIVPTNYTFLLSKSLTKKMEDLLQYGAENGVRIYLSASVDGKYCERNRPFKTRPLVDPRDDKFYDKMFQFNRKWHFGFHPMVYSDYIDKWKLNFLWFQENFKKYDIPFHNIYLLEVRNPEWHSHQLKEFGDFLRFLVKWTFYKVLEGNERKFLRFLFLFKGYNILSSPFTTVGRGLGCSIQSMLYVRLSDLKIVPCHRTSYKQFELAEFVVDGDEIVGIKALNPELMITIFSLDARNFPYCEQCPIKHMCPHGCLGAQYEFTGDLFTPFPTLCALELTKVVNIVKALKDIGVLNQVKSKVSPGIRVDIENVEEFMEVEKCKPHNKCI